jgi:ABC-type branched-subunit amino acid transport system substrate-binding protein
MEMKIGILLPRSDMFPTFALDFLNGLKLVLEHRGNNIPNPVLIVESVGNATGDAVLKSAEKMILQENVDLTISFCSVFKLKELVDIFDAYKKPLIHVDLGGNVLKNEHTSPYVIHHTLNLWQSAYISGVNAVNLFGKNAALAISFYDGGYHLAESFVKGFTDNGGNIVFAYVSPMDYKSESFSTMIEGIQGAKPDFVYTLFSYKEERKVLNIIAESELNKTIPFLVSPLISVEPNQSVNINLENMFSFSTWDFEGETPSMNNFKNSYLSKFNNLPNIIGLLGYEVGLTVSKCIETGNIPALLGDCIKLVEIESPRGKLIFSGFNESVIPINKIFQYQFSEKVSKPKFLKEVEINNQEELYKKFETLPYSGWQNPYIIT